MELLWPIHKTAALLFPSNDFGGEIPHFLSGESMAISVYKEGDTHTVNGVKCTIVQCLDVAEMHHHLENGCVLDEQDLYPEQEDFGDLNPVRLAAKEKGIEGWDTKRIKTLQALLDGTTEG